MEYVIEIRKPGKKTYCKKFASIIDARAYAVRMIESDPSVRPVAIRDAHAMSFDNYKFVGEVGKSRNPDEFVWAAGSWADMKVIGRDGKIKRRL